MVDFVFILLRRQPVLFRGQRCANSFFLVMLYSEHEKRAVTVIRHKLGRVERFKSPPLLPFIVPGRISFASSDPTSNVSGSLIVLEEERVQHRGSVLAHTELMDIYDVAVPTPESYARCQLVRTAEKCLFTHE